MTTDIKEWIATGRNYADAIDKDRGFESGVTDCLRGLSDALEAMAGEVERLKTDYGLLCDTLRDDRAAHAAERDRLKAVLKPRLNAKAIEGLQEILEAMEAMDEREAPFLKTLLDWHEASRKALGDAS